MHCFCDMALRHGRALLHVRDGPRDPVNPVQATRGDLSFSKLALEKCGRLRCEGSDFVEDRRRQFGVRPYASGAGEGPCCRDPLRDSCRRLAPVMTEQLLRARSRHRDGEVESVKQRARQSSCVACAHLLRAPALSSLESLAARARVHRCHQLEVRRQRDGAPSASQGDRPVFEGLPQQIEHRGRKLSQLVEKENTAVSEADLPGPEPRCAPSDDRHL